MTTAGIFSTTTGRLWASSPVASSALPGATKAHAEVLAIVSWDKECSEPKYRTGLRNETWEVVVTELMFEPDCLCRQGDSLPIDGTRERVATNPSTVAVVGHQHPGALTGRGSRRKWGFRFVPQETPWVRSPESP